MAILQVVTANKADSDFADFTEAQDAYAAAASNDNIRTYLLAAQANNEVTVDVNWDSVTQTLTYSRTWDETAYNTYVSENSADRPAAKTNLEAAGWTVTQTVSVV